VIFFLSHSSLSLTHKNTHTLSLFACRQEGGVGRQFACRWRHREFLPCLLFPLISSFLIQTSLFYLSIYIYFYFLFLSIYISICLFIHLSILSDFSAIYLAFSLYSLSCLTFNLFVSLFIYQCICLLPFLHTSTYTYLSYSFTLFVSNFFPKR